MLREITHMLADVRRQCDGVQLSMLALQDRHGGTAGAAVIVTFELLDKTYESKLTLTALELATATDHQMAAAVRRLCDDVIEQLANAKGARVTPEEAAERLRQAHQERPEVLALNAIAAAAGKEH